MTNWMTRRVLVLGLTVLWLAAPAADAQYAEDWVAKYKGDFFSIDWISDMVVRDGFVYVTGREAQFTSYYATVKYDDAGQELWVRRVVDGQSQRAEAMAVDAAGNVYVTGYQKQFGAGLDVLTLKYSPDGDVLWEQHFSSPGGNNQPNDMAFDASGNIYIAGASWVTAQQDFDMLLLKYDADGNLLWDRTLDNGDGQLDTAYELAIDPDGNAILAGFTEPNAYLAKYSPTGELLWEREKQGFSTNDEWRRVETDAGGNIYAFGEISPPGQPNHLWLTKYDPAGDILWERTYTGTASQSCYVGNLVVTSDGGVVITGQSWDAPSHISIVTIRYAADGTKLWQRLEKAGFAHTTGDDVALDAVGNIYVTGYGYDFSYQEDVITLGYTPDGDLLWTQIYSSPDPQHSDYPQAIAVDEDANVFVAAHSWTGEGDDFTTIRYSPTSLGAETSTVSAQGGTVDFSLDAGRAYAFRDYIMLGSVTGTTPGFPLPGGTTLPLNFDAFTTLLINQINGPLAVDFLGTLDAGGQAAAQLNTGGPLPPSTVGVKIYFAFTVLEPFDFVSDALEIEIVD